MGPCEWRSHTRHRPSYLLYLALGCQDTCTYHVYAIPFLSPPSLPLSDSSSLSSQLLKSVLQFEEFCYRSLFCTTVSLAQTFISRHQIRWVSLSPLSHNLRYPCSLTPQASWMWFMWLSLRPADSGAQIPPLLLNYLLSHIGYQVHEKFGSRLSAGRLPGYTGIRQAMF